MSDTLTEFESGKGLTIESIWALFRETAAQMKENDREIKENFAEIAKMQAETDAQRKENDREIKEKFAEVAKMQAETRAELKETDRLIKELSRKWGNTSENIGFSAEKHFQTALEKAPRLGGIEFDDMMPNVKRERRGECCEFDIMLLNHSAVAIFEVKHRVPKTLPEKMVQQKAREFRKFFPEYKNHELYLGVAGMSIEEEALVEAKKYGVGVLTQTGDAIECANITLQRY